MDTSDETTRKHAPHWRLCLVIGPFWRGSDRFVRTWQECISRRSRTHITATGKGDDHVEWLGLCLVQTLRTVVPLRVYADDRHSLSREPPRTLWRHVPVGTQWKQAYACSMSTTLAQ